MRSLLPRRCVRAACSDSGPVIRPPHRARIDRDILRRNCPDDHLVVHNDNASARALDDIRVGHEGRRDDQGRRRPHRSAPPLPCRFRPSFAHHDGRSALVVSGIDSFGQRTAILASALGFYDGTFAVGFVEAANNPTPRAAHRDARPMADRRRARGARHPNRTRSGRRRRHGPLLQGRGEPRASHLSGQSRG